MVVAKEKAKAKANEKKNKDKQNKDNHNEDSPAKPDEPIKFKSKIHKTVLKGLKRIKDQKDPSVAKTKSEEKGKQELTLNLMNEMYDNFLKKEEYLTGVLNTKCLSTKNSDFRTKV